MLVERRQGVNGSRARQEERPRPARLFESECVRWTAATGVVRSRAYDSWNSHHHLPGVVAQGRAENRAGIHEPGPGISPGGVAD